MLLNETFSTRGTFHLLLFYMTYITVHAVANKIEKLNDESTSTQVSDDRFFESLGNVRVENVETQQVAEEIQPVTFCQNEVKEWTKALLDTDISKNKHRNELDLDISSAEWKELYTTLIHMIQHPIGFDVCKECDKNTLLNYLRKAFKVDDKTHFQVMKMTESMDAPVIYLNVEVIEAKDLISKDATGTSDPFCELSLESAPEKKYITTVKAATLTPMWKEHFDLQLGDIKSDNLFLEVWHRNGNEKVSEKIGKVKDIKDVTGLIKLVKDVSITATTGRHDNKFIGLSKISLKDIPVSGSTQWYSLEKNSKNNKRGMIKLKLSFRVKHNSKITTQEHRHLTRILLLHELETAKVEKYFWAGWSAASEALIIQHRVQRGLSERDVSLSQWIEYSRIHQQHPFNFAIFSKLVMELVEPIESGLFTEQETRLFWDATKLITYSCLDNIKDIRRFTAGEHSVTTHIEAILRILSSISSLKTPQDFDLFPRTIYDWFPAPDVTSIDVIKALNYTVIQAGSEWFDSISRDHAPQSGENLDVLKYHVRIVQLIIDDLEQSRKFFDGLFISRINFQYTKTLYIMYEKRINDMSKTIVENMCLKLTRISIMSNNEAELNLGTALFDLYRKLQRFAVLGSDFYINDEENMEIRYYHMWFKAGVAHWLDIAAYKSLRQIERAVELDTLEPVDSMSYHSSSPIDTLGIFDQIKIFWNDLAWPDVDESYNFIAKIIDNISKSSIYYADIVSLKAETIDQQRQESKSVKNKIFQVSEAWCIAINNIDYMRSSIEKQANDLGLEEILDSIRERKTQLELDRSRQAVQLIIENTRNTLEEKIVDSLKVVASKMQPYIYRYIKEGAELIDTKSYGMDSLMNYLETNTAVLNDKLNENTFEKARLVIWEAMYDTLYKLINENLKKNRSPLFYSNLHSILDTLIEYFGLGPDELASGQELEKLERLLKVYGMKTGELIHRYNLARVTEQSIIDKSIYGILTVRAQFVDNSLNLQILNARILQSTDSNGKSNSYVKIRLSPMEKFNDVKLPKTKVQRGTLFPLFDETFNIPLTLEQRNIQDAILIFEVKKENFLFKKYVAEAFLPFKEIPINGHEHNIESLAQIHLKLSRPTDRDIDIIRVLKGRKDDTEAMDFISQYNKKLDKKSQYNKKGNDYGKIY